MDCRELVAELVQQIRDRDQDVDDLNAPGDILSEQERAALRKKITEEDKQINGLKRQFDAQGCIIPKKQPQEILEIQNANPPHPNSLDVDSAQRIALGQDNATPVIGGTYPSWDAKQEWKQVLAPDDDYEGSNLVGLTGWALGPDFSGADVPFDHPFPTSVSDDPKGWTFDWEFLAALDQPTNDPNRYTFLLTPGDQSCEEEGFGDAMQQAQSLKPNPVPVPTGPDSLPSLFGVEIEGGLLPARFAVDSWASVHGREGHPGFEGGPNLDGGGVVTGDRVAVWGRWIVDCGHLKPIVSCDGMTGSRIQAFRTEVHPPLVMAAARMTTRSLRGANPSGVSEFTRVLFTSRPFLASQRYTPDLSKLYSEDPGDGNFVDHMIEELKKITDTTLGIPTPSSLHLEAHPIIKSHPFQHPSGSPYELHVTVRLPHHIGPPPLGTLLVSYQFTRRTGCIIRVIPGPNPRSVEVVISLNQDEYQPPQLPNRHTRNWTRDDLDKLTRGSSGRILKVEVFAILLKEILERQGHQDLLDKIKHFAELIFPADVLVGKNPVNLLLDFLLLEQGIITDFYDRPGVNIDLLDASRAVTLQVSQLKDTSPGQGTVLAPNDSSAQPFPFFGWLELSLADIQPA
jgi:hypothetical protein